MKKKTVTIQMKTIEQYFQLWCIMLVVPFSKCVDEILKCGSSYAL